ncbi:hypothetical protein IEN85_15070 [Pelagicoccus sp. NFK12]|uniref:Uncharacterized protein n=1 Tax=Pelagicoccus enzymogenes TaxID=2773457 RepID=A0A927FAH6_9BACT|nr:hypothetical protein [Pelagicoccus enzymogenes]MBD5780820.1 hypothetical protein [Pelagicoccus enzymogenes]MDQ8200498.1 hypothetical protein [Pelagicoccus enzymogenes]
MKTSKSILARHALLIQSLTVLIVVAIALPPLDPYRQQLAELSQLPVSAFWIPLLGLLLILNAMLFRRIGTHLVDPSEELVNQTKLGTASIAFKKKSKNFEEDHLKHFIESQALRSADLENEVSRMEGEIERISELSKVSPEAYEALQADLKASNEAKEKSDSQVIAEQSNVAKLEKELLLLRRELKQANRELETAREESEAQLLPDTQRGTLSSILVERLKTPLSLINNLAWRLAKSWADTPPAQVREGLEEITRQSQEQLELLKRYQSEEEEENEKQRDAQ